MRNQKPAVARLKSKLGGPNEGPRPVQRGADARFSLSSHSPVLSVVEGPLDTSHCFLPDNGCRTECTVTHSKETIDVHSARQSNPALALASVARANANLIDTPAIRNASNFLKINEGRSL